MRAALFLSYSKSTPTVWPSRKLYVKLQYGLRICPLGVPAFYEFRNLNPLILRATVHKSRKLGGIRKVKNDGGAVSLLQKPNKSWKFRQASWYEANDWVRNLIRGTIRRRMGQRSVAGVMADGICDGW
jgi:hypothetical protein